MTAAEARALISDGRKHDEAMTPSPWRTHTPGCNPFDHICGWSQHHEAEGPFGGLSATGPDVWTKESALVDAAGIAWIRTNLARLLDYAELGVLAHERDHQPFMPGQRDLVLEVCHDLINRAMRNEADPVPSPEYAAGYRAKEAAIRALLTGYAAALEEIERLQASTSAADLCGGVIGADDDDRIGTIRAHFAQRPSMWLRDAMIEAVDAYRKVRP